MLKPILVLLSLIALIVAYECPLPKNQQAFAFSGWYLHDLGQIKKEPEPYMRGRQLQAHVTYEYALSSPPTIVYGTGSYNW